MKKLLYPVILLLTLSIPGGAAWAELLPTLRAVQEGYTGLVPSQKGKTVLQDSTVKIGKDYVACYRFKFTAEDIAAIGPNGMIDEAWLRLVCANCSAQVRLRLDGQFGGAEPLVGQPYNLTNREKTPAYQIYPGAGVAAGTELKFPVTDILRDIIDHPNWPDWSASPDDDNAVVLCLSNEGSSGTRTIKTGQQFGAVLDVTYTSGGSGGGNPNSCALDTTGDKIPDLNFSDLDGDGYCDFPVSDNAITFNGTLMITQPFEFIAGKTSTSTGGKAVRGATLSGNAIRVKSEVLSDFLSPVVLSDRTLNYADLELIASSSLSLLEGAVISNLGSSQGKLLFQTKFFDANINIEAAKIGGSVIEIFPANNLEIKNQASLLAASRISIKTGNSAGSTAYGTGDITISNSDIVVGDSQGTLVFKTGINQQSVQGKLTLSGNTMVAASLIDLCGVGDFSIEPSVRLNATTIKWPGSPACSLPSP